MLQGLPEYQTDEMPTWALDMSDSLMPVAYSMAWDAPCDLGCVMYLLIELSSLSAFAVRSVELVNARLWICEFRARCNNNQFDIFLTLFDVAIVRYILHAEARLQGVEASSFFLGALLVYPQRASEALIYCCGGACSHRGIGLFSEQGLLV